MSDSCNFYKLKRVQNNALQESWLLDEGNKTQEFQMLDFPDSLECFFFRNANAMVEYWRWNFIKVLCLRYCFLIFVVLEKKTIFLFRLSETFFNGLIGIINMSSAMVLLLEILLQHDIHTFFVYVSMVVIETDTSWPFSLVFFVFVTIIIQNM